MQPAAHVVHAKSERAHAAGCSKDMLFMGWNVIHIPQGCGAAMANVRVCITGAARLESLKGTEL